MNVRTMVRCAATAACLGGTLTGVAQARNPHCAGGIQYVVQGMRDKDKGNTADYQRQMNKAIQQLGQCQAEDPADYEAIGYLGWAYAEVESAGLAGRAFETAVQGLTAKGNKKLAEWVTNNRDSYWARSFNEGIKQITDAQTAADAKQQAEADKYYAEAMNSLARANKLRPNHPQTIRNLGSVYALTGRHEEAMAVFAEGLRAAPGDSNLTRSMRSARIQQANSLVEGGKFEEAIGFFNELIKAEPANSELHLALADIYYRRAGTLKDDAQKSDFRAAAAAYGKAAEHKPGDADLTFNAALASQNAGDFAKAVPQWQETLKRRPEDPDALAAMGAALVELGKCVEAVTALHQAVNLKPQEKTLHRQLGAIYTKCGSNAKGTEELMVYLAMHNGQPVADPAAAAKQAKAGSEAAKTLATLGSPDQVNLWEADKEKYETWFYWAKKSAYTFKAGGLVVKSDWSVADTKLTTPASAKK